MSYQSLSYRSLFITSWKTQPCPEPIPGLILRRVTSLGACHVGAAPARGHSARGRQQAGLRRHCRCPPQLRPHKCICAHTHIGGTTRSIPNAHSPSILRRVSPSPPLRRGDRVLTTDVWATSGGYLRD